MTRLSATAIACALFLSTAPAGAGEPFTSEVILPEDVLIRVADLWEQGARYEAVIDQILAAAARPDWSGGCGCDAAETAATPLSPGM